MKLTIESTNNGYDLKVENSRKYDGPWVYKANEILPMLEFLGLIINERKIEVKEK